MVSISLGDKEHIAKKLAEKKHGGNVSNYVRDLVQKDFDHINQKQDVQKEKARLILFQILFYTILTTTVVMIGLTTLYTMLVVILPIMLFIFGIIALIFMILTIKTKRYINEVMS